MEVECQADRKDVREIVSVCVRASVPVMVSVSVCVSLSVSVVCLRIKDENVENDERGVNGETNVREYIVQVH